LRIDASGQSRSTGADPKTFISARELEQRSMTEAGRRYRAWRETSRKLQADPRLIAYYSFEDQERWERTLRDQAENHKVKLDGGIVGCEWAEGRWPGKAALDFKRTSDRVRINIPGEFPAMTLMTWVRVDDYDHRLNSLLLADGWGIPGEVHWELNGKGSLIFAARESPPRGNIIFESPVVIGPSQLGLWTHLATVFSPASKTITTYVNGAAVAHRDVRQDFQVKIGWANIGNWSNPPPNDRPEDLVRNLNGRIDEFIIFGEALDAREILSIYEAGKPTS
jgi:hypothetical protein